MISQIFFQVVGDLVLCAMDWKALSKCDIEPIEVADKDFVKRSVDSTILHSLDAR